MSYTRRKFLKNSLILPAAALPAIQAAEYSFSSGNMLQNGRDGKRFPITIFSKVLQFLSYEEMAKIVSGLGFDGIDLTVRPGGHVLPENVEKDLTAAVAVFKKYYLQVYSIVTTISDAEAPHTKAILKTAMQTGIRHYRMAWINYNEKEPVLRDLETIESKLRKLAKLNEKYNICGHYQNHSGTIGGQPVFGGAVWDLAMILKKINSPWLGTQYDVYHAAAEANTTWPAGLNFIAPYIKSITVKDFRWSQKTTLKSESVPLGEGILDLPGYFQMLKKHGTSGPLSLHCEYALGGAERGLAEITIDRNIIINSIKKDLELLRRILNENSPL